MNGLSIGSQCQQTFRRAQSATKCSIMTSCRRDRKLAAITEVARLEGKGAKFTKNERGEVVWANFYGTKLTDAGLVHLKGLTELKYVNQGTASNPRPRLGLHSSRLTGMLWRPSTSPPLQSGRKGVRHVLSVVCDGAEDTASPLCRCHDQSPRILDEAGCSRTHRVRRRLSQPQTLADHGLRRSVLPVMSRHAREPGRRAHSPAG